MLILSRWRFVGWRPTCFASNACCGALTLFSISLFQQRTHGWDRDLSKTHFTSTIAKATCLSSTMHEAGWKWPGNTLLLNRLIQHWQSPQSKLYAPFLWRLTLYSLRVPISTQRHNFMNIWWLSWNFATKIVLWRSAHWSHKTLTPSCQRHGWAPPNGCKTCFT